MTILHTLAAKQTTVLCSLHQPCSGIFARLSKVILLGHGRTLYFGPPASLAGSLRGFDDSFVVPVGYNAADFALDLVGDMTLQGAVDLADNFAQGARGSALSEEISAVKWNGPQHWDQPHSAERAAGWTLQVCELSRRVLVGMWRNPLLVAAHWTTCCMVAVLMIILYSKTRQAEEEGGAPGVHNRLGALFFVVAFLALASLSALDTFIKERPLFVRERASKLYHVSAYFLVRVWWDLLLLRALPALGLGAATYHLAGTVPSATH